MDCTTCPACSSTKIHAFKLITFDGANECQECGAVFGEVDQDVFDRFVEYDDFAAGKADGEALYYFDFVVENVRRHGWCDKNAQCVQTG